MSIRYETNEKDGMKLLYPDQMEIRVTRDKDEKETVFVVVIKLSVSAEALQLPNSRPMTIQNRFLALRKPKKPTVLDFQFVPGPDFTGTATIVVENIHGDDVENAILHDIEYFDPVYSGDSELFYTQIEIARVSLPPIEVEKVRSGRNVVNQIIMLQTLVTQHINQADIDVASDVSAELIQQHALFVQLDGHWNLQLKPGKKDVRLVKMDDKQVRVHGDSDTITLAASV